MYNPQLKTFLAVADAGSFSKAAAQMYITAPAVIKQINLLEQTIGAPLFHRNHRGLELTKAGKVLYQEARHIILHCEEALHRVKQSNAQEAPIIRVGFSPLSPAHMLVSILPQLHALCPGLQLRMIPYINNAANAHDILKNLGEKIDVVMGIFDSDTLELRQCAGVELFDVPLCCAVSVHHPLSQKASLTIQDLYGEKLLLVHRGWSQSTDTLWNDLSQHPQIQPISFDAYSVDLFNRCVNENMLMMAVSSWDPVHPQIKYVPVDWQYTIPLGLLHSPEPSSTVRHFLEAVQQIMTR